MESAARISDLGFAPVAPHRRHDAFYFAKRLGGDQITPDRGDATPYRSRTAGSNRAYFRLLVIDREQDKVVFEDAFRSEKSLRRELAKWADQSDRYDVYICPNSFHRNRYKDGVRDGRFRFRTKELRFLNDLVIDLDWKKVAPELLRLWIDDPAEFGRRLRELLCLLGIRNFMIVQTRSRHGHAEGKGYGLQIHVLIKPVRANYGERWKDYTHSSTRTYKTVSAALYEILKDWGADKRAAKRPVQPFRPPGMLRPGHGDFRTELVADVKNGTRISLFDLLKRIDELYPDLIGRCAARFADPAKPRPVYLPKALPWAAGRRRLYQEIMDGKFSGKQKGQGRRETAFLLAVALFAEAHLHRRPDDAQDDHRGFVLSVVRRWNQANSPALPDSDIVAYVRAVADGDADGKNRHVTKGTWLEVCSALGVSVGHPYACTPAKPRAERQRDHDEEVAADLRRTLIAKGGCWEGVQGQLPAAIEQVTGQKVALRTVQRILPILKQEGIIRLESRRGRGGYTRVELAAAVQSAEEQVSMVAAVSTVNPPTPDIGAAGPCFEKEASEESLVKSRVCVGRGAHVHVARDAEAQGAEAAGGTEGGAQAGDMTLLDRCRRLFGAHLVAEVDVADGDEVPVSEPSALAGRHAAGRGGLPADPDRMRREMRRELRRSMSDIGVLARLVEGTKTRAKMRRALEVAADLSLGSVSRDHDELLNRLRRNLLAAQRRFDIRREEEATKNLQRGRITAEDLRWLVERKAGRSGEREALQRIVRQAKWRKLDRLEAYADALREATERLQGFTVVKGGRRPSAEAGPGQAGPRHEQVTLWGASWVASSGD